MKNTDFIEIELCLEDYKKIMNLDYFDIERKILQTSAAQYIRISLQPERSKREDRYIGGYFPPPWNPDEYPEKTEGWLAFQEEQRKDPRYYGCGALNTQETE